MSTVAETNPTVKLHISLNVKDVEISAAFYEAFFGVPTHKRRPGYANFDVAIPPVKLALNQDSSVNGNKGSLNHLGMVVSSVEEVNAARERLEASGLVTFDEGDTICCYALQNKVWVHDPDGHAWEIYTLLDDMNEEDIDDHHADSMTCCEGTEIGRAHV